MEDDLTFPSDVTAANTVAEYGDHAMSPTTLLRSYENMGLLVELEYYKVSYSRRLLSSMIPYLDGPISTT